MQYTYIHIRVTLIYYCSALYKDTRLIQLQFLPKVCLQFTNSLFIEVYQHCYTNIFYQLWIDVLC